MEDCVSVPIPLCNELQHLYYHFEQLEQLGHCRELDTQMIYVLCIASKQLRKWLEF